MESTGNAIEMDQVKVTENESEPLRGESSSSLVNGRKHEANGAAIEMGAEEAAAETDNKKQPELGLEEEFYRIIFAILIPYILIGVIYLFIHIYHYIYFAIFL